MNRALRLHPASLALGLVLAGIAFLSMSQAIVATSPLRIEYAPHPRDMVQVIQGVTYTVPPGRIFVLTALGTGEGTSARAALKVNGLPVQSTGMAASGYNGALVGNSVVASPTGLTAKAGDVLEVWNYSIGSDAARAWGYLAPQ